MSKICDRSPCDGLLGALGHYIFGAPEKDGGFYALVISSGEPSEVGIEYCPFCGTRLEEVPDVIVEKFMRPRRRKRTATLKGGTPR